VALGENPSDGSLATSNPRHGGDHGAFRVGYSGGPLTVAFSAGMTNNVAGPTPTGNNAGDYLNTNLAGRYDLGFAKVYGQYVTERLDGASAAGGALTGNAAHEAKTRTILIGTSIPVGAGNVKFSYVNGKLTDNIGSPAEKGRLLVAGYDYFFSKRTNVYAAYSHVDNNSVGNYAFSNVFLAPSRGQSSSGLSAGLRHQF
jgi:predicted porin